MGKAVDYSPRCPWPSNTTVQWGNGIIPAVAFFEAFVPGTFIRGEGKDIAEAEQKAFDQLRKEITCNHHWGRTRRNGEVYTNGAGWCRKCNAFRSKMFKPIVELGHHRRPLEIMENWLLEDAEHDVTTFSKYERSLHIRKKLFGVKHAEDS